MTEEQLKEIEALVKMARGQFDVPSGSVPASGIVIAMLQEDARRTLGCIAPKLYDEVRRLRGLLEWAVTEIEDLSTRNDDGTPEHHCGYIHEPDTGHCQFHDKYWTIKALLGQLPLTEPDALKGGGLP